jgi:hypothetical protein
VFSPKGVVDNSQGRQPLEKCFVPEPGIDRELYVGTCAANGYELRDKPLLAELLKDKPQSTFFYLRRPWHRRVPSGRAARSSHSASPCADYY